jgi:uncharacterized protein (TIGR02246 family)
VPSLTWNLLLVAGIPGSNGVLDGPAALSRPVPWKAGSDGKDRSAMPANLEELQSRISVLEDREEIRRLIQEYRRTLDERDLHSFSLLFAENGIWTGGLGEAMGPDAIRRMLEDTLDDNPPAPGPTLFHLNTDPAITVEGERATAFTFWVHVRRTGDDTPGIPTLGYYNDLLTKERGRWRFLRREAHRSIPRE